MHSKPQISGRGDWGDAYIKSDNRGKSIYCCKYCRYKTSIYEKCIEHFINCIKKYKEDLSDGYDYVICEICNFHAPHLMSHLKAIHSLTKEDYIKIYNKPVSSKLFGLKVSSSILNDSEECLRRSNFMAQLQVELNKLPDYKLKISNVAKQTSSRPDILEKRSKQLQKWREDFPEEFKTKCTAKMLASDNKLKWFSKPEKMLFEFLCNIEGFNFKFNQVVKSVLFDWTSRRKQIDIADKSKNIYIEYDGPFHFDTWMGENNLLETKRRDQLLEKYILDNNYLLIRISYDQFIDKKTTAKFKEECLFKIIQIINEEKSGVFKIGIKYE